ncbi:alginate export family protein [Pseudomonas jilinensis]|uniref:Ion channel protein AlgE n=1 Tax=Pseudomonas jilinensis TaxID=2078689 RepID=A0A396RWW8_9PSED|nr:alginate export family protein [Pseudomonas jilinensis]RHW20696.1 ion channel protein AlgE [Pseudomonas jilinensis]
MRTRQCHAMGGLLLALLYPTAMLSAQEGEPQLGQTPETSLITHKLSVRGGYGPEETRLGEDRKEFISIRYEPTLHWFSPDIQWPRWEAVAKAWFNYDSQPNAIIQDEGNLQVSRKRDKTWAEMREFYVRRNLLGNDPRFSLTVGRQRFAERFGVWWDDSLEAIRFDYRDSQAEGFIAVAERFYYYNTDFNSLEPEDEDIRYLMGDYRRLWRAQQWAGVRTLYEHDYSDKDLRDRDDFKGWRLGAYLNGQFTDLAWLSDYHAELIGMRGDLRTVGSFGQFDTGRIDGWAALLDAGKRFDEHPWRPRLGLTLALTDKPDDDGRDGFYLNRVQSDRRTDPMSYSNRLVSNFVTVNLTNLQVVGVGVDTEPAPGTVVGLRVSDLRLRNSEGRLPVRVVNEPGIRNTDSRALGQVVDLNYYWRMYPMAVRERRLNLNTLVSASYFKAGSALNTGDDFQVTLGLTLFY